ncbi:unnamed protein product [Rhizophagus irregularis]|uniref:BED-type domain-containing protein n=1 Tax=Rhizophagus irregularis TaxID=588596 RepID=A0A916EK87_9GLOM|nr:unnamed protein product [Rhizophagus irregularis]CAB5211409.1 unnamed protein product [Rhizophagus irregularis]CAB5394912.1 unnamed protein product [Rhizophagus irregularis]
MTEQEQGPNNRLALSNTEMEKESETHIKSGRPQSGVWKHFDRGESRGDGHWEGTCKYCKKFYPRAKPNALRAHLANNCKDIPEEWRRHFNYILINNLNDVPTDKPLTGESVITQDWKKVEKLVANQPEMDASLIDEAISLAFIMCGIPFRVINNPFFINALKILNPNYIAPSRKTLSGRLLDNEVAKVNNKIDEVLEFTNNLTIGLDEDIRDNHSEVITTPAILTILHSRGFFSDMQHLSEVLFPIKNAILAVEAANSTLADAYVNLMKIAAVIQNLPADEYKGFRNHCIKKFNHRFEEFNDPAYQLAFFLHPAYKGAGLKFGAFSLIANYAGELWQKMGKSKKSCEKLLAQMRIYKEQICIVNGKPNPYVAPYTIGSDTPLMWWNTCEVKPNYLQRLAIKLFSITPSSAACERMFSSLGWLYGKCRTRLEINKLEGLAKVYQFNLSTAAEKFHKTQTEISPETMKNIAETVFNEFEEEAFLEESENAELPNPAEHLYTNEQDLNLDISNMINFQSSIFNSNGNNNEHEESSDDESSDEDDEDDEYDVNEIVISIERMQCT